LISCARRLFRANDEVGNVSRMKSAAPSTTTASKDDERPFIPPAHRRESGAGGADHQVLGFHGRP